MFSPGDPRAALAPRMSSTVRGLIAVGTSSYVKCPDIAPQAEDAAGRHWIARGQHFVLVLSQCTAGAELIRADQADEYMVLSPDAASPIEIESRIEIGGERQALSGHRLAIVPPGASVVRVPAGGRILRLFSHRASDLAALSANAAAYATPQPNIARYAPWPDPVGGYRLRSYDLDVPEALQKHGRIWRSTTLMIYLSPARVGARDVARFSPHAHEDFEQGTFNLEGEVIQHLRWPWTADSRLWRDDEHEPCPQHSLTVMPPHVQHTTQYLSVGENVELVIFAPPRDDWSRQPGWVLNEDEYPMPTTDGLNGGGA